MNISELARRLKVTPQQLREILRAVGIDIGAKAIKIDKRLAQRVLRNWPKIKEEYEKIQEEKEKEEKKEQQQTTERREVVLPALITVRELAQKFQVPINRLMEALMKNGIFVSLNEKIDFDTAAILGMEFSLEVKKAPENEEEEGTISRQQYLEQLLQEKGEEIKERPPIVVVMGHVDHGKTKLLDTIRQTNIAEREAGGITQHIGAYQAKRKDRIITFIDTPGHEAFTAMRSRGAKIADVAILVIAADDGIKPQTIEAIKIIEKAQIPFIVALNKIDKPEANIEKVKQELANLNIIPEDWGGKTICVPISAKEGKGIDDLLDMLLLTVDLEKEKRLVDHRGKAVGTVIEAHIDKGEGPVATMLVQKGCLWRGDFIKVNGDFAGKARIMKDYNGRELEKAFPAMPVRLSGLKVLPKVGDILEATHKKEKIKKIKKSERKIETFLQKQNSPEDSEKDKKLNILLKADVLGSTEAIIESLEKIESPEIQINIINRGLGNITESDILQTKTILDGQGEEDRTLLIGFNVKTSNPAQILAKEKNIPIHNYSVIYDFLREVKNIIQEMASPEIVREDLGVAVVLKIFKTTKQGTILGGRVKEGVLTNDALLEIKRGKEIKGRGQVANLQSGRQDVASVEKGQEFGLLFQGEEIPQENDLLLAFREKEVKKEI